MTIFNEQQISVGHLKNECCESYGFNATAQTTTQAFHRESVQQQQSATRFK